MDPITGVSLARIGLGAVAIASPDQAAKLFGLDAARNQQLPYVTRLFGGREVALGLVTLAAPKAARKRIVTLGVAVDAIDAAAGVSMGTQGRVPQSRAAMLTAPALLAVIAGISDLLPRRNDSA